MSVEDPMRVRNAKQTWSGGIVTISADAAKLLFPEYVQDPLGADHYVASSAKAVSDAALETILRMSPTPGREFVLVGAGSPGSGKTATLASSSDEAVCLKIDETLDDFEDARSLVLRLIDSGRKPVILWVYVDDICKTVDRMVQRAQNIGRTDRIDHMAKAYHDVPRVLSALKGEFSSNLKLHVADNSGKRGQEQFYQDSSRMWSPREDALATRVGLAQVYATNRMFRANPNFEVAY